MAYSNQYKFINFVTPTFDFIDFQYFRGLQLFNILSFFIDINLVFDCLPRGESREGGRETSDEIINIFESLLWHSRLN